VAGGGGFGAGLVPGAWRKSCVGDGVEQPSGSEVTGGGRQGGDATDDVVGIGVGGLGRAGALESMRTVDTVLFDKTGTLTKGQPTVTAIETAGPSEGEVLALGASAEADSEHPLARAIVAAAEQRQLRLTPATDFTSSAAGRAGRGSPAALAWSYWARQRCRSATARRRVRV
jgi:hypothetical protein